MSRGEEEGLTVCVVGHIDFLSGALTNRLKKLLVSLTSHLSFLHFIISFPNSFPLPGCPVLPWDLDPWMALLQIINHFLTVKSCKLESWESTPLVSC